MIFERKIFRLVPHKNPFIITHFELINCIEHDRKVIDRLSRKIQKQKKIISIISNSNYILEQKYRFLMHRENKLQQIEQMFKSGTVDLKELTKLVNENF